MQNINVNIVPDNFPQTIRYSQGDIGRQFKINVADFGIPVGATVKIQATKPSGFGFSVAGVVAGNSVTFTTTEEMTDEAGRFQAELQITSGGDVIGTANFLMIGERNPHPEGTTDGSQGTIIPELTLLVERVEKAASDILDMEVVATTLPAGSQASYSYDEDLNKATFGIPEGQAGAGAAGVVASAYSAAKTYKVGDYVLYNSNLYRCTTAITTAEAWTAAHWTQVVLADDVTDLKSDLIDLGENGFVPVEISPTWQNGYINQSGTITSSTASAFALIPLSKGQVLTIGTRNNNITILGSTNADSVSVGDSVTPIYKTSSADTYQEFTYTAECDINVVVCVRKTEYKLSVKEPIALKEKVSLLDSGLTPIEKTLTWSDGWIRVGDGKILSSTASQFALVHMKKGETVKVGTKNNSTCIIGCTSANSVSVGDTVRTLKGTGDSDTSFMEHIFKAEYDVNVVICVLKTMYYVDFYEENAEREQTEKIPNLDSAFFKGYYNIDVVENGSFDALGVKFYTSNRIRTDVIYFTKGTRIVIDNGSFEYACATWENSVSSSNNRRNDDSFSNTTETYVAPYDGCMVIAFRDSNNASISPSDFDGSIKVYPSSYNNIADTLHKLDGARHIRYDNAKPLTILHLSDIHADKVPYNRIIEQANYFANKIDDMICTGDMVADTYASITPWWDEKVMTCIGNHDTASRDGNNAYIWDALSMADRDAYYIAPFESNWDIVHTSGTSYYYKDYTDNNVRLIVMDAMLYNSNGAEATAQTSWLANLLSDAITNGLHVLIAIHSPHGGATPIKCSFTELGTPTMPTWTDCNTPQSVIDSVASAIQNGLHFIGYICGHTHKDQMWDAENDKSQLMYCVTCATTTSATGTDLNRGVGFDAYNLITIDTYYTRVKIIRGGGADIDFDMRTREAICFDYSTGEILGEVL